MVEFRCTVCNYIYTEVREGEFDSLPEDWRCPVCNALKSAFVRLNPEFHEKIDKTVSDVFVAQLVEWGVRYVFGIPGTSTLGLVDALRRNRSIRYIQVRHEASAAFMASAIGKLTGHPAVCMAVAGPGASNLTTGLMDAALDKAPVIAVTVPVPSGKAYLTLFVTSSLIMRPRGIAVSISGFMSSTSITFLIPVPWEMIISSTSLST
ncbi:thiamine pyrophosphate-binding protein [Methanothermobacter wolfeii]|uniref:Thiamine pyrophosphate-binding protein n=1 Tax=Methanothermobacter wolfeii TaxID=145261 RepID=A0ABU8TTU7_METWO